MGKEIIIVIGDKVIRTSPKVLSTYVACANQMIADGDLYDYYQGIETKRTLDAVCELHRDLGVALS